MRMFAGQQRKRKNNPDSAFSAKKSALYQTALAGSKNR